MKTFVFDSLEEAYPQIIKSLLEEGKEVSPRGQLTKEIAPACITLTNPRKRVISSSVRKLNFGFMCAELVWILNGSNDVNFIGHYNSNWRSFSDDGSTLNGAYGKRIFKWDSGIRFDKNQTIENDTINETTNCKHVILNQFQLAYETLKNDPDTRQATIVLFDPYKDYKETKDKPCTNLLRFMIRDGKLNMTVFMRSNDIWFGTPYDIFNFTMLQEMMAGMLNIEVGIYTHIADSLHIYKDQFEQAKQLLNAHEKLLYTGNLIDSRVSSNNINGEINAIFAVEQLTRLDQQASLSNVIDILNVIGNPYLKSLASVLALYNFRKYKRDQSDLDSIKQFITNEFSELTKDWVVK